MWHCHVLIACILTWDTDRRGLTKHTCTLRAQGEPGKLGQVDLDLWARFKRPNTLRLSEREHRSSWNQYYGDMSTWRTQEEAGHWRLPRETLETQGLGRRPPTSWWTGHCPVGTRPWMWRETRCLPALSPCQPIRHWWLTCTTLTPLWAGVP